MILASQGAFYPDVGRIAVYLFSKTITVVDVKEMPLEPVSYRT